MKDPTEIKFSTQASHELLRDQQNISPKASGVNSGLLSVTSNNSRKVTREDIAVVQNLIERCLQLYMNRNEVVNTLLHQARIEPGFTTLAIAISLHCLPVNLKNLDLVWHQLEEENVDFFKAYYGRLILKKQIIVFNQLLEQQYHLMKRPASPKVPLASMQNVIEHMPVNNVHTGYTTFPQLPIPLAGHPQIDSMGSLSSCHMVNGIPASGNFHTTPIASGKDSAADIAPFLPSIKSEMDLSPASVASNGQFPFAPTGISELSVETLALDSTYSSHMTSPEGLQLGPDCGGGNFGFSHLTEAITNVEDPGQLGNYPGSDILLDSPEQNDIVEEFFADIVPSPESQTEEES